MTKTKDNKSSRSNSTNSENASKTNEDNMLRHEAPLTEESKPKSPWCAECFKRKNKKQQDPNECKPNIVKRMCCRKDKQPSKQTDQSRSQANKKKRSKKKRKDKSPSSSISNETSSDIVVDKSSVYGDRRLSDVSSESKSVSSKDKSVSSRDGRSSRDSENISGKHVPTDLKSDKIHKHLESIPHKEKFDEKDVRKTCCYLCAKNTLAIAGMTYKKKDTCDKVVQATCVNGKNVKLKITKCHKPKKTKCKKKDAGTMCPIPKKTTKCPKPKTKNKLMKFNLFSKFRRKKCCIKKKSKCVTEEKKQQCSTEVPAKKVHCCKLVP